MPKTCTPRSRRRLPILGTLTLAATVALAGCTTTPEWAGSRMSGAGPATLSPEQTYDTLMKVADATRAGGDLSNAVSLYRRAHQLQPQSVQPLQRLGDTLAQMQSYTDAVQAYQAAQAKIEGIPHASPPWNWSAEDLRQSSRGVAAGVRHGPPQEASHALSA